MAYDQLAATVEWQNAIKANNTAALLTSLKSFTKDRGGTCVLVNGVEQLPPPKLPPIPYAHHFDRSPWVEYGGSKRRGNGMEDENVDPKLKNAREKSEQERFLRIKVGQERRKRDVKTHCQNWATAGYCDFMNNPGGCKYIHEIELWSGHMFKDNQVTSELLKSGAHRAVEPIPMGIGRKTHCTKWLKTGTCAYGEGCIYLHQIPPGCRLVSRDQKTGQVTMQIDPDPTITKPIQLRRAGDPCVHFLRTGMCAFASSDGIGCKFSHDVSSVKGRKVFCDFYFRTGRCDFMVSGCKFSHDQDAYRRHVAETKGPRCIYWSKDTPCEFEKREGFCRFSHEDGLEKDPEQEAENRRERAFYDERGREFRDGGKYMQQYVGQEEWRERSRSATPDPERLRPTVEQELEIFRPRMTAWKTKKAKEFEKTNETSDKQRHWAQGWDFKPHDLEENIRKVARNFVELEEEIGCEIVPAVDDFTRVGFFPARVAWEPKATKNGHIDEFAVPATFPRKSKNVDCMLDDAWERVVRQRKAAEANTELAVEGEIVDWGDYDQDIEVLRVHDALSKNSTSGTPTWNGMRRNRLSKWYTSYKVEKKAMKDSERNKMGAKLGNPIDGSFRAYWVSYLNVHNFKESETAAQAAIQEIAISVAPLAGEDEYQPVTAVRDYKALPDGHLYTLDGTIMPVLTVEEHEQFYTPPQSPVRDSDPEDNNILNNSQDIGIPGIKLEPGQTYENFTWPKKPTVDLTKHTTSPEYQEITQEELDNLTVEEIAAARAAHMSVSPEYVTPPPIDIHRILADIRGDSGLGNGIVRHREDPRRASPLFDDDDITEQELTNVTDTDIAANNGVDYLRTPSPAYQGDLTSQVLPEQVIKNKFDLAGLVIGGSEEFNLASELDTTVAQPAQTLSAAKFDLAGYLNSIPRRHYPSCSFISNTITKQEEMGLSPFTSCNNAKRRRSDNDTPERANCYENTSKNLLFRSVSVDSNPEPTHIANKQNTKRRRVAFKVEVEDEQEGISPSEEIEIETPPTTGMDAFRNIDVDAEGENENRTFAHLENLIKVEDQEADLTLISF